MKSQLLQSLDLSEEGEKQFSSDASRLLALPQQAREAIAAAMPVIMKLRTPGEQKPVVGSLKETTGLSVPELNRFMALLGLFSVALAKSDAEDTVDDWIADLTDLGVLKSAAEQVTFRQLIEHLNAETAKQIEKIGREHATSVGTLPFLDGAGTTVELRAVLREQYKWGTDLSSYSPEIIGTVPVISVSLGVDSGPTRQFSFQASPMVIEHLVKELQAALKIAEAAKALVQL